jgi:hypothetical protein
MRKFTCQHILNMGLRVGLCIAVGAGLAAAQQAPRKPSDQEVYCTGLATTDAVPADTYVITGENSGYRITFSQGDSVFINHGSDQGVKVGDEFEVIRPVHPGPMIKWFPSQPELIRAMGTMYTDIGHLKVLAVQAKTATANITMACDEMQRGDLVRPFTARPIPPLHDAKLDPYAAPTKKSMAMVVTTLGYGQVVGAGQTVFVNLGSGQGVKVGDYFRVFRYQGTVHETAYQDPKMAYKVVGLGQTPVPYNWDDLPRQIIGEGVVMRTAPNAATVLLTTATQEIYTGDYVEIE